MVSSATRFTLFMQYYFGTAVNISATLTVVTHLSGRRKYVNLGPCYIMSGLGSCQQALLDRVPCPLYPILYALYQCIISSMISWAPIIYALVVQRVLHHMEWSSRIVILRILHWFLGSLEYPPG